MDNFFPQETMCGSSSFTPGNPDKYINENHQQKVIIIRDILLGNKPQSELTRNCCMVLREIHDLQQQVQTIQPRNNAAAVILHSISQSLSAMSANLITSLGMKSDRDAFRAMEEMKARARFYKTVLTDINNNH